MPWPAMANLRSSWFLFGFFGITVYAFGQWITTMWAAIATWPDIGFAVSLLSQFLENLGELPWKAVKRVLRYLKGTKNYKLTLGWNKNSLLGYCDTAWASQNHRHSILAYIFQINGGRHLLELSETKYCCAIITRSWVHHFNSGNKRNFVVATFHYRNLPTTQISNSTLFWQSNCHDYSI